MSIKEVMTVLIVSGILSYFFISSLNEEQVYYCDTNKVTIHYTVCDPFGGCDDIVEPIHNKYSGFFECTEANPSISTKPSQKDYRVVDNLNLRK